MNRVFNHTNEHFQMLGELQPLNKVDRDALVKTNGPLVSQLINAGTFNNKMAMYECMRTLLRKASLKPSIKRVMDEHNVTSDNVNLPPVQFDDVFQKEYYPDVNTYNRHREVMLTLGSWTHKDPFEPVKEMDQIQTMLMGMIILFSTKGVELRKGAKVVEDIQRKYAHMLHKYLRQKYGDSVLCQQKLSQGMAASDMARESLEIAQSIF